MDKDMKKNVERLGQASRLIEEEQMHGDNIAVLLKSTRGQKIQMNLLPNLQRNSKFGRKFLLQVL